MARIAASVRVPVSMSVTPLVLYLGNPGPCRPLSAALELLPTSCVADDRQMTHEQRQRAAATSRGRSQEGRPRKKSWSLTPR
jgi:hypothetical protein